jgi:hypothetical protein
MGQGTIPLQTKLFDFFFMIEMHKFLYNFYSCEHKMKQAQDEARG